ncbi:MAG TPA: hypothetical protein VLM42_06620 [Bryobacteraceae bacterium]|nr:hypothetical protein [Bryobacteraceae bacterium]
MLGAYNQATLAISTTVEELLHGVGASSSLLYDIRRHAAEKARIGFELAELAYEAHVHEHHCEAPVKYAHSVINAITGTPLIAVTFSCSISFSAYLASQRYISTILPPAAVVA